MPWTAYFTEHGLDAFRALPLPKAELQQIAIGLMDTLKADVLQHPAEWITAPVRGIRVVFRDLGIASGRSIVFFASEDTNKEARYIHSVHMVNTVSPFSYRRAPGLNPGEEDDELELPS